MKLGKQEIENSPRRQGYKLTPQRQAIIRMAVLSEDHLTPAALHGKLRCDHPNIGLVTVYRTLEILIRLGLICEVHAGGSCRSYILSTPEQHHHLICSQCGRVVDFSGHNLRQLRKRLSQETGFEIRDQLLEFVGLCVECSRRQCQDVKNNN
jgi:Fur family ferric uptake transcriptional regulator